MVSIHRILIVLYMTIRVLCFVFRFKRGTEYPRLNEKVLGKPYTNRYGNNSPTHIHTR